ncbi:MAG: NAD-dependent epimerase/dehydratase family protein [Planctomycetota bacterium]
MLRFPEIKTALVTGATGYVAGWVIKRLLEEGFTVHAAVRDPSKADKLKHLDAMVETSPGTIKYFKSDLMQPGSYAEAMDGCAVVFHTASPFVLGVEDPQKDLVDPAVQGTRNVLEQVNQTPSVERAVVTSSCAAIYGDNIDLKKTPDGTFTEAIWNTSSSLRHQAYSYSKTMAEKEAWKIAEAQGRWTMGTVNPSFVLGPATNPDASGESISFIRQNGDGTMRSGTLDLGMGVVDVRDVAEMHLLVAFHPAASGRYITSGHNSGFLEVAQILRERFGDQYPIPKRAMPKWLVWLVGPIIDKRMTRQTVSKNVGLRWVGDNSKSRNELGMVYRPLEETVVEMFQQQIDRGAFKPAGAA